jgi:uncharacterized membrane protein YuzA (DUF378 family)
MQMKGLSTFFLTLFVLLGAINWGLIGALNFNLVDTVFGSWPFALRIVYILIGFSGIIALIRYAQHK